MSVDSLRGRKVLVTGAQGFIGTNLCRRLTDLGAEVTALDRRMPARSDSACCRMRVVVADIRDEDAVRCAVTGQEVIFALAGASGAADSNNEPADDLDVNCRGQLTLLEACRRINPEVRVIFPSSRLVYGRPQWLPVDELHPLAPESIYAAHKLAVENYLLVYSRNYGIEATILRISNPYGPLQSLEGRTYGIANRFIQTAVAGGKITLFGDGAQRRDYFYIDDLVDAFLRCATREEAGNKIYNIGFGIGITLLEFAEMVTRVAGQGEIERVPWPPNYAAVETGDYVSDITLVQRELGWRPTTALADGIARTVDFYGGVQRSQRKSAGRDGSLKGSSRSGIC